MSDELADLFARVPADLKRLIDADERTNKEVVTVALQNEFGGQRKSELEMRIEHKEANAERLEREADDITDALETERQELAALRERRESMQTDTERYHDALDEQLSFMEENGGTVWPENPRVAELATEFHGSSSDGEVVVRDLRDRAAEQERDISRGAFRDSDPSTDDERGIGGGW